MKKYRSTKITSRTSETLLITNSAEFGTRNNQYPINPPSAAEAAAAQNPAEMIDQQPQAEDSGVENSAQIESDHSEDSKIEDALDFFQSMFSFNTAGKSKNDAKLAAALKTEAETFEAVANEEMKNARTSRKLAAKSTDLKTIRALTEIAVWHYAHACEKFAKAASGFEEAGRIHPAGGEVFSFKARRMSVRAAKAEFAAGFLKNRNVNR